MDMDKTKTEIISDAMRVLSTEIQTQDGVANAACRQAADRLDQQEKDLIALKKRLSAAQELCELYFNIAKVRAVCKSERYGHKCDCGAYESQHSISRGRCQRIMVAAPSGEATKYTLDHQRGYFRHDCGCWSRWIGNENSLKED